MAAKPSSPISTRNPPCKLVQTSVMGTSHQMRAGFAPLRSASMIPIEIESSNKVNMCGRAKKCMDAEPTENSLRTEPISKGEAAFRS